MVRYWYAIGTLLVRYWYAIPMDIHGFHGYPWIPWILPKIQEPPITLFPYEMQLL